jgi:murein DD-endopeptidase MepM/ murein hydrolase activator NlpD
MTRFLACPILDAHWWAPQLGSPSMGPCRWGGRTGLRLWGRCASSVRKYSLPSILLPVLVFPATAQKDAVSSLTLTPSFVVAGSPELVRISASDATSIDGEWLGHKLQFFRSRDKRTWIALAGVDVEAPTGPSTLHVFVHAGESKRDLSRTADIHPSHYRTGTLSVDPKFVTPGPDELKQIAADNDLKAKAFAAGAAEPLWHGNVRGPVPAPPTDSFGTRRMFNGKLASIHKGMDFRAPMGTVVRASNSGVIVLARPLYYEGNCVVIDHGLGLYTLSMHFSRIDVHEGQHVAAGDKLGLSGATGRVTGPHLHWAVRWEGAYLDPAKLLRLNLSNLGSR